jgi:SOS regulatory protein LexA
MPRRMDLVLRVGQLREFYEAEGREPSYAEMLRIFKYKSKNAVHGVVQKLLEYGYVTKSGNGRISFTSKLTGNIKLLGTIAAGFPSPAEEELVDVMSLDEYLVASPDSTYMLTVSGDSMIDAGIHPGDIVLVERGKRPKKNDIIVAQVDEDWTIKYFGKDSVGVYLDPANAKYKRIRPQQSLLIAGVVSAVIRKY